MTIFEITRTDQKGKEWIDAVERYQMLDNYQRRKAEKREKRLRLEERNEALRKMINRK